MILSFFYDTGQPVGQHPCGERILCKALGGGDVFMWGWNPWGGRVSGEGSGVWVDQQQDVAASVAVQHREI